MRESIPSSLSVSDAASAIIALINSSPHSPRPDQIEAIVAKAAAPPPESDVMAVQQLDEFRRRKRAFLEYFNQRDPVQDDDPVAKHLEDELDGLVSEIWAKPALTWGDVFLPGEIALYHENGLMKAASEPDAFLDEKAAAQLIDAIVTVGRRAFGQADDGRREGDV